VVSFEEDIMADLPIPGDLSPEAQKLRQQIQLDEAKMRIKKLQLRKLELQIELQKIDYELQVQNEHLQELRKEVKEV